MPAYGYEFYLLVVNSISHSFAALTRELSSWPLEDKIHIHARACNILYLSLFVRLSYFYFFKNFNVVCIIQYFSEWKMFKIIIVIVIILMMMMTIIIKIYIP